VSAKVAMLLEWRNSPCHLCDIDDDDDS